MILEALTEQNISKYLAYLHKAMAAEPDMMPAEQVDEAGIRARLSDSFYQKTKSILAIEDEKVIGRIEYHFYGCLQDGYRMAYVDWIFVLREYRHRGIGQALFRAFERDCREHQIDQYYLIEEDNKNAERFYSGFAEVERKNAPILRKTLKR